MPIQVERIEAEVSVSSTKAVRELRTLDREIDRTTRDRSATIDVRVERSTRDVVRARDELGRFTRAAGAAGGAARGAGGGVNALGGAMRGVGGAGRGASGGLRAFTSGLGGAVVKIALFASILPYVISLINTLGGAAFALGASLFSLVGVLGAMPGLLAAVGGGIFALVAGLGGVGEATKAYTAVQKAAFDRGRQAVDLAFQRVQAERSVTQAVEGVTAAQRRLAEAEKDLVKARKQAAKDLRDGRLDMADAILDEEAAVDAVAEAQERLRKVQERIAGSTTTITKQTDDFTGKVYEIVSATTDATDAGDDLADAQRAVKQAELAAQRARNNTIDQRERLNELERKGIAQSDLVVDATQRVTDAQRGLRDAIWSVEAARNSLSEAMKRANGTDTASTAAFAYAMSQLTPAGRAFVTFLNTEFLPAWKRVKDQIQIGLLGDNHLENALRRIMTDIFPVLERQGRNFGHTMGVALENWANILGDRSAQIDRILTSSNRALGDIMRGFGEIGKAFLTIADEARPLTEWLAGAFYRKMTDFREKTDEWAANGKLARFFERTRKVATQVWNIFGNILTALWNIGTAALPTGDGILASMEKTTAAWAKWTADDANREKIRRWFKEIEEPIRNVATLMGTLVREFLTIGENDGPVMEDFNRVMKDLNESLPGIVKGMQDLSQIIPPLVTILKGMAKVMEHIDTLFLLLGLKALGTFLKITRGALESKSAIARAFGRLLGPVGIAMGLEWLRRKADMTWKEIFLGSEKETYNIQGAWDAMTTELRSSWRSFLGFWRGEDGATGLEKAWKKLDLAKHFRNALEKLKRVWQDFKDSFKWDLHIPFTGDGPGRGAGAAAGAAAGAVTSAPGTSSGPAARMAASAVRAIGGRVTSGYRTPAQNKLVGGSLNSYHTDRTNPAQDIAGSPAQMAAVFKYLARSYGQNIREMIYGNQMVKRGRVLPYTKNDHWDHVHVAHQGGEVKSSWPTMPGLKRDERPAILQVGERVVPRIENRNNGGGLSEAQLEDVLRRVMANAKAPVKIDNTFNEKVDPMLVSAELAWRLQ